MTHYQGLRTAGPLFGVAVILSVISSDPLSAQVGHSFTIEQGEGFPVAVTSGGAKYEDDLFTYHEVLTIPQERVRKHARLSEPTVFTMDEEGFLYVVDVGNHRIARFDSEGRFVRGFGAEGEEVGEFMTPILQSVEEGIVTIYDMRIDRVTRFTTEGALIDTLGVPMFHFPFTPIPERPTVSDVYRAQNEAEAFDRTHMMQPVGLFERPGGGWIVPEVSFRPRGDAIARAVIYDTALDTVAVIDSRPVRSGTTVVIRVGGRGGVSAGTRAGMSRPGSPQAGRTSSGGSVMARERHRLPFAPLPVAHYVPGRGIVLTTGEEPLLEWFDLEGNPLGQVRIDIPPTEITAGDEEAFEADWRRALLEVTAIEGERKRSRSPNRPPRNRRELMEMMKTVSARGRLESMKRYMTLPRTRAYWDHLFVDGAGYTWLRVPEVYHWGGGAVRHRYWIISPEGEFLGSTMTPPTMPTINFQEQFRAVPMAQGHFMGVTKDESTGTWRLTVYRVSPAVPGLAWP